MNEDEKARLYREVTRSASESAVLRRMHALGFWPHGEGLPPDPPEEHAERARIEAELADLRRTHARVEDPEAALVEERRRRWEESKARRAEARARRLQEQQVRREEWDRHRSSTMVHAGIGVSAGLQDARSDEEALSRRGLPVLHRAEDLAGQIGIELGALRWLTYHRRSASVVHYHRYEIAKKTGGVRCISAPKPALAFAQRWVFDQILRRLDPEPQAHGFVPGRSIVTNASTHAGRAVVVNLDMKDFFPSVTFRRVKGLFRAIGYSEHLATVLALLCTEPPRVPATLDGKTTHIALGDRVLPQGACTSPSITNALCRRLDRRLDGLARRHGFTYTRYADDLTFSGDRPAVVGRLLRSVRSILAAEGFVEHPSKTRIMRRGGRQEVTGVTVNDRPNVSRRELRTLRAILHNAARLGLESQNREDHPDFASHLRGRVEFACMVDPSRAGTYRDALSRALQGPGAP
ncbi:reverse transcriptase family protein [Tautonia plasticadhaerens]|uniref:RNA-directed DNA polymerase n=1 Tax=Tautonia plasticadhaerens TaxID=2527974 RepID=A0A518HC95_9BACT|nr:reverse transcriptase family protein [Tautonia plasticadhaerens]QDV38457.1 Reverse transcriptase (RNA-dependent DNA polymerase) [Tautonia plasticadhaerens]